MTGAEFADMCRMIAAQLRQNIDDAAAVHPDPKCDQAYRAGWHDCARVLDDVATTAAAQPNANVFAQMADNGTIEIQGIAE